MDIKLRKRYAIKEAECLDNQKKCLEIYDNPGRAKLWHQAASVYEHLKKCKKRHHVIGGKVECAWE